MSLRERERPVPSYLECNDNKYEEANEQGMHMTHDHFWQRSHNDAGINQVSNPEGK